MTRYVQLVTHTGRARNRERADYVAQRLRAAGVHVLGADDRSDPAVSIEVVLVLGGDGTLLRGAEIARGMNAPLLGVNLGHVGFLAEAEPSDLDPTLERVLRRDYVVEERMTVDVTVRSGGDIVGKGWALNEAAVVKTDTVRMMECVVAVDSRPVSRFGCDGVVCATPTGSTAYAFSAGGPVVWPEVEALLVVPVSAHALFARPLVVSPDSEVAVDVLPGGSDGAVVWCDGRRSIILAAGHRVEVRRGAHPVRLARLRGSPFTDRLVAKFGLPVEGWRGPGGGTDDPPAL